MASPTFNALGAAFRNYHAEWGAFWAAAELGDRRLTALGMDLTHDAMASGHNAHMHGMFLIVAEAS
jgi:hypothetical protein